MTKKKVMAIVEDYVDMDYATLGEFRDRIDAWIKQHSRNAMFESQDDYDGYGRHIVLKAERLETDEEYEYRKKSEEHYKKIAEERDRKEFERLKKKYGES